MQYKNLQMLNQPQIINYTGSLSLCLYRVATTSQIPWLFRYIPYMSRTFCATYDSLFVHVTKQKCFQTQLACCRV